MTQNNFVPKAPLYTDQMAITTTSVTGVRIARSALLGTRTMSFFSTVDCNVKFGTVSVGAATSTDDLFKANTPYRINVDNGTNFFSVKGASSGTFCWWVEGANGQNSVQDILGSLYVDDWSRESAASATVWASRGGRLITNSGTVTFAPDGSNFNGGKVIGTTVGASSMVGTVAQLAASASRPYVASVSRFTNPGGVQVLFSVGTTDNQLEVFLASGVLKGRYRGGLTDITGPAVDTNVHFFEVWADGTNFNFSIDGVNLTAADTNGTVEAVTVVSIGDNIATGSQGSGDHSRFIFASSAPSALQRAQLLALVKQLDNF